MADLEIPSRVSSAQLWHRHQKMVVQVSACKDGTRKSVSIAEVLGVKDDRVDLQDIFIFDRTGVTDAGKWGRAVSAAPA